MPMNFLDERLRSIPLFFRPSTFNHPLNNGQNENANLTRVEKKVKKKDNFAFCA